MKMFRGAAVAAAIAGSMAAYNAQAVNLATDGIGDVAIAPFYTVRDGWSTLINLTNTQNAPVAVKVRFHEAHNSRDVLDFMVLLSAYDVFTGIVTEDANGNPVFRSTDTANNAGDRTCTIPTAINIADGNGNLPNVGMSPAGYRNSNADNDRGDQTNDRLREGYIEFIVMGYAEQNLSAVSPQAQSAAAGNGLVTIDPGAGPQDVLDVGFAIENHNCDAALERAFTRENGAGGDPEILWTARQFGESINALKFNFRLINVDRGVEAGNSATTWANFYNPAMGPDAAIAPAANLTCDVWRGAERGNTDVTVGDVRGDNDWDPAGGAGSYDGAAAVQSCQNLIAEQQRQSFLEPTLNDAFPIVGNAWDDQLNAGISVAPDYATAAASPRAGAGLAYAGGDLRGIDALSATIMRRFVANEWADNSAAGVSTDWIITQPTKGFYVDDPDMNFAARGLPVPAAVTVNEAIQSQLAYERYEAYVAPATAAAGGSAATFPAPYAEYWGENAAGQSCNQVDFTYFDRAEQSVNTPGSGVIVSPQPPETVITDQICHESMIVNFNNASAFTSAAAANAQNRINVDTSGLPAANNGWMFMDLAPNGESLPISAGIAGVTDLLGLPVIGFNLKVRSLGNGSAATNYASTLDHGYMRDVQ